MSIPAARSGSDNCDLLLMTFSALSVTFLLLGHVPFCGPSKGDACPPTASFMASEEMNCPMSEPEAKDQIINSQIVNENLFLSNSTNIRTIDLLLSHVIILCLHVFGVQSGTKTLKTPLRRSLFLERRQRKDAQSILCLVFK